MEEPSRQRINLRDWRPLGTSETSTIPARQSLALHDRKVTEEELIKYMSNLPSYLERGENRQEKVLNVGVLDWGRLEKWQCGQKQIPHRNSRHSLSSDNSSSSFSTEGSYVDSSRGPSCSPAHQRMRRPSLQSHMLSSPVKVHSQDVKSFEESIQKFQYVKGAQAHIMNEQRKFIRTDHLHSKNYPEIKLDQWKRKDSDPMTNSKCGTSNGVKFEAQQYMRVNTTQDGDFMKRANKLQEEKACSFDQDVSRKSKREILLMPRDLTQGNCSQLSESPTMLCQKGAKASRSSFSEMPKDMSPAAVTSDVPHSCPLPRQVEGCTEIKWCSSDGDSVAFLPNSSHLGPHPAKVGISPSRARISENKKSSISPINSTAKESSTGLGMKLNKAASEKPRSTSPFRRLGIGMGKISKSFSPKDSSSLPQLSTIHHSAKSAGDNAMTSCRQGTSSSDPQNATSRARASPLRRLLDPLLKPKVPNCHHSGEPLQRDLVSTDRACKSNGQLDSSAAARQPGVVNFNMASRRAINIGDSCQDKKHGSAAFQALLRVAVKNGQPLFTFAVDNERNILAATVKKLSSTREDEYSCIYTFFAIQEIRKKNGGWMNQGGKGKGHDYIPNVVAQLKVSGSQFSCWTRENCMEQSFAREFVLFAVDLQQAEPQRLDFQPNDELAAIVVKIPRVTNVSTASDGHHSGKNNDLPEMRFSSTSGEQPIINGQSLISATVILPSGVHSLPNKGGPSSLIQRWRSGGSCDCGGWDLSCKLRIFENQSQLSKKTSPSKACAMIDKFEFVSQGGEEENQPVFSFAPFKDGIYSVEFTSSLSIIQAFSLCIAIIDSKKLCEIQGSCNSIEAKTSLQTMLAQNDGTRGRPYGIVADMPAKFVSYPPHSPFGRV
ncbi:uncharacterized protein LOC110618330 isoform X2 [Manihot esculenta]|uniref:DUF3527 domain-containing protein n=2 Tax=Manihot esculenta TaxID=3983 RepID=A0A251LSM0_MANES|nr:uncharacterized protein LOC110618330 isoform X2 [Manihot esculenta]KAG8663006.1 hypothetical protein MANES_01G166800v8 [Manihot esculenta]OAY61139.1 hypothetical protein MANES_01G166800v8 [Manihot esculenta]OAY61140.1 hypothetical protein MANES_01G166800v8 [Manihot esculenta]OAY61141.1 hypothetical protein MANES_01G166800v8 [Manihot esculenta]